MATCMAWQFAEVVLVCLNRGARHEVVEEEPRVRWMTQEEEEQGVRSLSALVSGLLSWGPPAVLGERKMTRAVSIRCEACIVFYVREREIGRGGGKNVAYSAAQ